MGLFDVDSDLEEMLYGESSKSRKTVKRSIKNEVLVRQKYKCHRSKNPLPATKHFHHKKPVSKGGKNTLSNIIALCPNCHAQIHHEKRIGKKTSRPRARKTTRKKRKSKECPATIHNRVIYCSVLSVILIKNRIMGGTNANLTIRE